MNRKDIDRRLAPFRIPKLQLWKSDSFGRLAQLSDGATPAIIATDPVGYAADASGHGRDFLQTVGARRPTLTEGGGGLFAFHDGVDDVLQLAGEAVLHTPPFTIVQKFRLDILPADKGAIENIAVFRATSGANDPWRLSVNNVGNKLEARLRDTALATTILPSLAAVSIDTWYLAFLTMDELFNVELSFGTVSQATATLANTLYSGESNILIGAENPSGSNSPLKGAAPELLYYSKALDANEKSLLTEFFA